jgi:hypothetical protein
MPFACRVMEGVSIPDGIVMTDLFISWSWKHRSTFAVCFCALFSGHRPLDMTLIENLIVTWLSEHSNH